MGQHLVECGGSTNDIESKTLDTGRPVEKLMTIGAKYISNLHQGVSDLCD